MILLFRALLVFDQWQTTLLVSLSGSLPRQEESTLNVAERICGWGGPALAQTYCSWRCHVVLFVLIMSNWNGSPGNMLVMSVAVTRVCMKYQSGSASIWTNHFASVFSNSEPPRWVVLLLLIARNYHLRSQIIFHLFLPLWHCHLFKTLDHPAFPSLLPQYKLVSSTA